MSGIAFSYRGSPVRIPDRPFRAPGAVERLYWIWFKHSCIGIMLWKPLLSSLRCLLFPGRSGTRKHLVLGRYIALSSYDYRPVTDIELTTVLADDGGDGQDKYFHLCSNRRPGMSGLLGEFFKLIAAEVLWSDLLRQQLVHVESTSGAGNHCSGSTIRTFAISKHLFPRCNIDTAFPWRKTHRCAGRGQGSENSRADSTTHESDH